jgi:hypothetical protein
VAFIITKSDVSTILGERFFLSNAFSSIIPVIYPLVFCEGIWLLYILVRAGASLIQVRVTAFEKMNQCMYPCCWTKKGKTHVIDREYHSKECLVLLRLPVYLDVLMVHHHQHVPQLFLLAFLPFQTSW